MVEKRAKARRQAHPPGFAFAKPLPVIDDGVKLPAHPLPGPVKHDDQAFLNDPLLAQWEGWRTRRALWGARILDPEPDKGVLCWAGAFVTIAGPFIYPGDT